MNDSTENLNNPGSNSAPKVSIVAKPKYVGNYELQQTIGEGSFAKVKLAVHRLTQQKVAIKIIDKTKLPDEYALRNIHREAQIMRIIDHPNVIQLFEVMETKKNLFLVLEYASGGELLDKIVTNGRLKEEEAKKYVKQVVSALDYSHSLNVVHRDLKAENLLLDQNANVKISDFGLSNMFDSKNLLSTSCGSPVYSAPELIEGKKYIGPEVDAWSLGINVYAMVVGDLPFADANLTALYESILKGKYEIPDYVSADCVDFISKLLVINPKKRASVSQMREHGWLSEGTSFLEPISSESEGGFRPKTEDQLDPEILDQLEQMGFERKESSQAVISGKFNQHAGTYYLLAYEKRQLGSMQPKEHRTITPDSETAQDDEIGQEKRGQPNGDVTSDELARVLFQVEELRQPHSREPSTINPPKKESKYGQKEGGTDRRSTVAKVTPIDLESKGKKQVIKRVRPTKAGSQQGYGQIDEHSSNKGKQDDNQLPRIQTTAPTRSFESKVVNLPSISNDNHNPLKTQHNPTSDLSNNQDHHHSRNYNSHRVPKSVSIPIDESLYLSKEQDSDGGDPIVPGPMGIPRTIRFAFNCTATTALPPETLFDKLRSALERNEVEWVHEAFLCECEWGDIRFEVEVCKLPRIRSYGLRLKRISGDIWEFKKLCTKLTSDLDVNTGN